MITQGNVHVRFELVVGEAPSLFHCLPPRSNTPSTHHALRCFTEATSLLATGRCVPNIRFILKYIYKIYVTTSFLLLLVRHLLLEAMHLLLIDSCYYRFIDVDFEKAHLYSLSDFGDEDDDTHPTHLSVKTSSGFRIFMHVIRPIRIVEAFLCALTGIESFSRIQL